jgi:hypothetical protein
MNETFKNKKNKRQRCPFDKIPILILKKNCFSSPI